MADQKQTNLGMRKLFAEYKCTDDITKKLMIHIKLKTCKYDAAVILGLEHSLLIPNSTIHQYCDIQDEHEKPPTPAVIMDMGTYADQLSS